jgi:hypothetical protein
MYDEASEIDAAFERLAESADVSLYEEAALLLRDREGEGESVVGRLNDA